MTKNEKILALEVYLEQLTAKLTASVPVKHKDNTKEYKRMLEIDLEKTRRKIESLIGGQ